MKPFLFFSYGLTKSGSTLAFQLTRTALDQAGMTQDVLDRSDIVQSKRINAVQHIADDQAEYLQEAVKNLGYPIVLKTHTRPDLCVVRMIENGTARAHAVIRDPRDVALSMVDHGIQSRAKQVPAFSEIVSLSDACTGIDNQFDSLTAWMQLPAVSVLKYDQVAFDTQVAAATILGQLGIAGDPEKIARHVLRNEFTQRNLATPNRHTFQMSTADSTRFLERYEPFYRLLLENESPAQLPPATSLKAAA